MVAGRCSGDLCYDGYAVDHKMAISLLVEERLAAWSFWATPARRGDNEVVGIMLEVDGIRPTGPTEHFRAGLHVEVDTCNR